MLPVYFPDLWHPERTVDMDQYIDMLMDPPPNQNRNCSSAADDSEIPCRSHGAHLTRPYVFAVVEIVKNWVLSLIVHADEHRIDPIISLRSANHTSVLPSFVSHGVRQLRLELIRRKQGIRANVLLPLRGRIS